MARSPLNATAPGTTRGLASRERSEVPIRAVGGLSSFGQPVERNESISKHSGSANLFNQVQNPGRTRLLLDIKRKLHCNEGKTQKWVQFELSISFINTGALARSQGGG